MMVVMSLDLPWMVYRKNTRVPPLVQLRHKKIVVVSPFSVFYSNNSQLSSLLLTTFKTHQEVWMNESNREVLVHTLLRIGSNMLLSEDDGNTDSALAMAETIALLEQYGRTSSIELTFCGKATATKLRDLNSSSSGRRDALKFFRKRTSCKCLKKMHLEARKTIPKVGKCFHCKVVKERALLSVCNICMVEQYCSRECQLAAWPEHKKHCDIFVECQDE